MDNGYARIVFGKISKNFAVVLISALIISGLYFPLSSVAESQSFDEAQESSPKLKGEFEASLVLLTGNSDSESNFVKGNLVQTLGENRYTFKGDFARSESDDVETAKRWSLATRYDRLFRGFGSAFIGETFESNRYAGFSHRFNSDLGASWNAYRSSLIDLIAEGGYRNSREKETGSDDFETENKGRIKLESILKSKTFKLTLWVEYLPNFTNADNWQANSELSIRYVLNDLISLKTSYLVLYDHKPNDASLEETDTTLATSLVASF